MSRYVTNIPTALSRDEAWASITEFMATEGFVRKQREGEDVWQKGGGWLIAPQFVKCQPTDGSVMLEAWVAGFALLPGVYVGEVDCMSGGVWAALPKSQLKPRVESLQRRLAGTQGTGFAAPAAGDGSTG